MIEALLAASWLLSLAFAFHQGAAFARLIDDRRRRATIQAITGAACQVIDKLKEAISHDR